MTLSELMSGVTVDPAYTGFVTNDDFVLAVDISGLNADIDDYVVAQMGVAGLDAQMNPITQDKQYIRAGQSTTKTGTQRTFKVTGDRYIGDAFQDYCFSNAIEFGTGNSVVVPYFYFCILTGKGEAGEASIIVNSDGSGNSGESAAIDVDLRKTGAMPVEATYPALKKLQGALSKGTSGKTVVTITGNNSGTTYSYKLNPISRVTYDMASSTYSGTSLTSGSTEISVSVGDMIEVVNFASSKAYGVAYYTVTAGDIG